MVAVYVCTSLWAPAPLAADSATPEVLRLSVEGRKALALGEYTTAAGLFDQAFTLLPAPTIAVWAARALLEAGRKIEAAQRYRAALRASAEVGTRAAQLRAQADAGKELAALLTSIPTVALFPRASLPSSTQIRLDGEPLAQAQLRVPLRLNPGQHWIEVRAHRLQRRHVFILAEGDAKALVLDVQAPPAQPTSTARSIGYAALGLGGVSLAAAVTTTIAALNTCHGPLFAGRAECDDDSARKTHAALRTAAAITTYAGLATMIGGLVLVLSNPTETGSDEAATDAQPLTEVHLGPGSVQVRGYF